MRFLFIFLFLTTMVSEAQQTITFPSSDGLTITADLYLQDKNLPYIVLFHQANFSRGEYRETAPKLMKLGYNCLAVDLRSGKEVNFVQNETAARAREKNLPVGYLDAEKDMISALEYVKKQTKEKIVVFGSSYSASLTLKITRNDPDVSAIIVFSPGEYFQPAITLKPLLAKFDKPIFVESTTSEYPFAKDMLSEVPSGHITWYKPSKGAGVHGSKALWQASPGSEECWMSLLMFFRNLHK